MTVASQPIPARFGYVIFDLDGTLVDSVPGIDYAATAAVAAVLPGTVLPSLRTHIGPPIRTMFERLLAGIDAPLLDSLEREFRRVYDDEGWSHSVAYPGAAQVLAHLRASGRRLFVATNKPLAPALKILEQLGLSAHLEAVASPDATSPPLHASVHQRQRPSLSKLAMVELLLTAYGLSSLHGLLVGDSGDDARAAAACGLHFAAAAYGYGAHTFNGAPSPAVVLPELRELLTWLAAVEIGAAGSAPPGGG